MTDVPAKVALVVDDDPLVREILVRQLAITGVQCYVAATHATALTLLSQAGEIEILFVDFNMSESESVSELIRKARQTRTDLRIVGISGDDLEEEFALHGVERFLMKPWRMADLQRAVQSG